MSVNNEKLVNALELSTNRTKTTHYNQSESLEALTELVVASTDKFTMATGKINNAALIHYLARVGAACVLSGNDKLMKEIEKTWGIHK